MRLLNYISYTKKSKFYSALHLTPHTTPIVLQKRIHELKNFFVTDGQDAAMGEEAARAYIEVRMKRIG